jgi:hypothetical protein
VVGGGSCWGVGGLKCCSISLLLFVFGWHFDSFVCIIGDLLLYVGILYD